MKNTAKAQRTKYLRLLEKFAHSAINALKKEHFNSKIFQEKMLKNYELFKKCEVVNLNSNYTKELEKFVNLCLDFSLSKHILLNKANKLDKLKKSQNYKKDKHKLQFKDYE